MLYPKPLVSIVVVTYNQKNYISQTLQSLIDQDYKNIEIIVSDDASRDGTQTVIQDFANRHPGIVIPLLHQTNQGVTGNCNAALKQCRGEFIAFAGGDDLYEPSKISAQIEWFLSNPDGVLCGHDVALFKEDPRQPMYFYSRHFPLREGWGAGDFLRFGAILPAISIMVRANSIPAHGFDIRLPIASDIKFSVDCLLPGGKYGYAPGILGYYRRLGTGLSSVREAECTRDLLEMYRIVGQERPDLRPVMKLSKVRAQLYLSFQLVKIGKHRDAALNFARTVLNSPGEVAKVIGIGLLKRVDRNGALRK